MLSERTRDYGYIAIPTSNHDLPRYSVVRTQKEIAFINREGQGYPLVYTRTDGEETYLVCINPTGREQSYEFLEIEKYQTIIQNKEAILENRKIILPDVGFWIGKEKEK